MKKIILSLITVGVVALPIVAMAQPPVTINSLPEMVSKIEAAVWIVFGLIAVICFVVAGILFLTAGGVPEKVAAARSAFLWGVAGVIVGILAYSIIAIVSSVV
jgi:phosphoglycerol transferase MdoB-like AlkP superfamily enzyme